MKLFDLLCAGTLFLLAIVESLLVPKTYSGRIWILGTYLALLFTAMLNPNVIIGVLLLIVFFGSYMAALSWVDLTFLMPATAFGNVLIALLSRFWLHEHLSLSRWCGILLLTCAVGFVANGPSRTEHAPDSDPYAGPKLTEVDPGVGL